MKVKLLLISASILLLTGCSKENQSDGSLKIFRVYGGGQLQSEYSYDSEGQLKNYTGFGFPGRKNWEINCHYDANQRLVKKESSFDLSSGPSPLWSNSYTEYSYAPNGRISEEKNYIMQNNNYILASKVKPNFNANGQLESRALYLPNDVLARITTYQYNNAGNIVVQEEYRYNLAVAQIEYRYSYDDHDNRRNPHIGLASAVPPFSVNTNNILRTTVTNYVSTPGTPIVSTTNAVYNSYNASGLPVNVFENGTNFVYEYE